MLVKTMLNIPMLSGFAPPTSMLKHLLKYSFLVYLAQKQTMKRFHIFLENNGLTPLQKVQFGDYINTFL